MYGLYSLFSYLFIQLAIFSKFLYFKQVLTCEVVNKTNRYTIYEYEFLFLFTFSNRFGISNGMLWFVYLDLNRTSVKNERERTFTQTQYTHTSIIIDHWKCIDCELRTTKNAICAHMLQHINTPTTLKTMHKSRVVWKGLPNWKIERHMEYDIAICYAHTSQISMCIYIYILFLTTKCFQVIIIASLYRSFSVFLLPSCVPLFSYRSMTNDLNF